MMIRVFGLVIADKATWTQELAGATSLGTDLGRIHGRCEFAEHFDVDITELPDELFELRGSLRLYPHPVGCQYDVPAAA